MGVVNREYEELSEAAVKAYFSSEARREQLEETDCEYVYSRRASMDELSECCTLNGTSSAKETSFEFYSQH